MLNSVCFGTNDLQRAGAFYDSVLASIGLERRVTVDNEIGYGPEGGSVCFWILTPFNHQAATHGNGSQVIFEAPNAAAVDRFHALALELGGADEGAPGPRDYSPGYYGAYCRDLDGNKLHAFVIDQKE